MSFNFIKDITLVWLLALSSAAAAQTVSPPPIPNSSANQLTTSSTPRGLLAVGGGYRVTDASFTGSATKQIHAELGAYSTRYDVKPGIALDVSAGFALWRSFGIKLGLSTYQATTPGSFQAQIPHPFFFNRPRSVSGQASALQRRETALDLHVAGIFAPSRRVTVMVGAGPTFFSIKQDFVTDFTYGESYPYDTATFRSVSTKAETESRMGFGAGATVGVFLTKVVGIAAAAQFAATEIQFPAAGDTPTDLKLGGFRGIVGFAARF